MDELSPKTTPNKSADIRRDRFQKEKRYMLTITDTLPTVHPSSFSSIPSDGQLPESHPDKLFQRRMPPTSAAFLKSMRKLCADSQTLISTITPATPNYATAGATFFCWLDTDESSKLHPGQVFLPRFYFCCTATVFYCASL